MLQLSAQEGSQITDEEYNQLRSHLLNNYGKLPVDAANKAEALLVEYRGRLTPRQSLRLHYTKAYFLIEAELFDQAYAELTVCKTLADQVNDPNLTHYYFSYLAGMQAKLENYELSIEAYLSALAYANQTDDEAMIARSQNNVGHLLIKMAEYDKALAYIEFFYQYGIKVDNQSYISTALNNLGEIALGKAEYEQAKTYFLESLAIREKHNYSFSSSWSHYNLGQVYLAQHQYEKARYHLENAIKIREASERDFAALMPKLTLAKVYLAQKEQAKALNLLESIISGAEQFNSYQLLAQAYHLLRLYYEEQQEYRLAVAAMDQYVINKQQTIARKNSVALMHYLAKIALNTKEMENAELRKQSELNSQQTKAKERQILLILGFGAVILIIVLLFLRYLAQRNKALKRVIAQLNKTQKELIEADKMSALTTLVSGMAHQLNTPLGVIITANSVMREKVQQIAQQLQSKRLDKRSFTSFIQEVTDILALSEKNSDKAAGLIQRFKMISAELEGAKLKEFELKLFITEKLKLLASQYQQQLTLEVTGTEVVVNNYPEVLFKVLEQLVQNTAEHTQTQAKPITSTIDIQVQNKGVAITYQDNGAGIAEPIRARIFEPFFTTKGMHQSLGLGLNIAYNSVLHLMQGKLSCHACTRGAKFVIEIPIHIEHYAPTA